MYKLRRKLLSQNFLCNRAVVKTLVRNSSIGKNDLVLEIGPGRGIITEELLKVSQHVIGVEIDTNFCRMLQDKFKDSNNLTIYNADILSFTLPRLPYKVFANIPFAIEGQVIRKLIDNKNSPEDCYLVMMKSVARRLCGDRGDNLFSLSHKPWFDFSIVYTFSRSDFVPRPNVDSVLLRFVKRKEPLVPYAQKESFQRFLDLGFTNGLPVYINLKSRYGKQKVLHVLKVLKIDKHTRPSYITIEKWIQLFKGLNH